MSDNVHLEDGAALEAKHSDASLGGAGIDCGCLADDRRDTPAANGRLQEEMRLGLVMEAMSSYAGNDGQGFTASMDKRLVGLSPLPCRRQAHKFAS